MISEILVEVLEANKFFVTDVLETSEALVIKTFKHLDEIEFRLQGGVLSFGNYRIPLNDFISNLSARGGEEQLSYVLNSLIGSAQCLL